MSLIQIIVSRYGGRLACDRQSGAIPAPGHSKRDRSVSLRLNADGKLLIHCFSDTDWRDVKAAFLRDGIAGEGDFVGNSDRRSFGVKRHDPQTAHKNGRPESTNHARRAWVSRRPARGALAERYLKQRGLDSLSSNPSLGFLPSWPMSMKPGSAMHPCLIARISNARGGFEGVQATFFFEGRTLTKRRLVFGRQKGFAIHLAKPTNQLLVGEGLESTASAARRFQMPAWALLNTGNLAVFQAPPGIDRLVIAHDHDAPGLKAAQACAALNRGRGVRCELRAPTRPGADWNDDDRLPDAP